MTDTTYHCTGCLMTHKGTPARTIKRLIRGVVRVRHICPTCSDNAAKALRNEKRDAGLTKQAKKVYPAGERYLLARAHNNFK